MGLFKKKKEVTELKFNWKGFNEDYSVIHFKNGETLTVHDDDIVKIWEQFGEQKTHTFFWRNANTIGEAKDFLCMINLKDISYIVKKNNDK